MLIRNSLMPAYKNVCKKVICKTLCEFWICFCIFYKVFLLLTFSCNFYSCQQRKSAFTVTLRLLISILILWLTLSLFAQKQHVFKHFAKINIAKSYMQKIRRILKKILHLFQSIFTFDFFLQHFLKLSSTKKISIYSTGILCVCLYPYSFFYNFKAHISTFCAKNSTCSNILQKLTLFCKDPCEFFRNSQKIPPNVLVHEPKMCHIFRLICTKIDNTVTFRTRKHKE